MVVQGDKRDLDLDEEDRDDGHGIEDSEDMDDEVEVAEREDEDKGAGSHLQNEEWISSLVGKRIIKEHTVEALFV